MPDKLTDNEIVKALDVCGHTKGCTNCPLGKYDADNCQMILTESAIDLINRLQAENTELLGKIDGLEANRAELLENIEQLESVITQIKAEAYKECIEKVKNELKNIAKIDWQDNYYYLVGTAFFDNLLKELVGEDG